MLWRFVRSLEVLKAACWPTTTTAAAATPKTSCRIFLATTLLLSAVLVLIATIVAVARIAYEEQSWAASLVLIVTIVQVQKLISMLQFHKTSFFCSRGGTFTWPGNTFQVTQTHILKPP